MEEKYFIAKITTDTPDENTGKVKKIRDVNVIISRFTLD